MARLELERHLHMYVAQRRYRRLLRAKRAEEEEARRREEARLQREAEAQARAEEARRRQAEEERLRLEAEAEETARHADAAAVPCMVQCTLLRTMPMHHATAPLHCTKGTMQNAPLR